MTHSVFIVSIPHTASVSIANAFKSGVDFVVRLTETARPAEGTYMIEEHFSQVEADRLDLIIELMAEGKNVYPMRDPLACICTGVARKTVPAEMFIQDWIRFRDVLVEYGGYPVRMGLDPDADMQAAFEGLGLYDKPLPLRHWNPSAPASIITAYKNGDMAYLEKTIPEALAQIKDAEGELRPWLEGHGYTSLPWYS